MCLYYILRVRGQRVHSSSWSNRVRGQTGESSSLIGWCRLEADLTEVFNIIVSLIVLLLWPLQVTVLPAAGDGAFDSLLQLSRWINLTHPSPHLPPPRLCHHRRRERRRGLRTDGGKESQDGRVGPFKANVVLSLNATC